MGVEHKKTMQTAAALRGISTRLKACATQFESAAQALEDSGLTGAEIRNAAVLATSLSSIENSAAKAAIDVLKAISEEESLKRGREKGKAALDAEAKANNRERKKG